MGRERETLIELSKTYKLISINNKINLTLNIMQIINQGGYKRWILYKTPRGKSLEKSCTRFHDHVIFFVIFVIL